MWIWNLLFKNDHQLLVNKFKNLKRPSQNLHSWEFDSNYEFCTAEYFRKKFHKANNISGSVFCTFYCFNNYFFEVWPECGKKCFENTKWIQRVSKKNVTQCCNVGFWDEMAWLNAKAQADWGVDWGEREPQEHNTQPSPLYSICQCYLAPPSFSIWFVDKL